MPTDQLKQLAHEVANQLIASTWLYWIVLLVLMGAGIYLSKYLGKSGEQRAVKEDLENILEQVRETTKITTKIQSVVSLGEWSERERRTLRRVKLEELLTTAHRVRDWLEDEYHRIFDLSEARGTPSPLPIAATLAKLYFPELRQEMTAFDGACDAYRDVLLRLHSELIAARQDALRAAEQNGRDLRWADNESANAQNAVRERFIERLAAGYRGARAAVLALDDAAAIVMAGIIAVPAAGE